MRPLDVTVAFPGAQSRLATPNGICRSIRKATRLFFLTTCYQANKQRNNGASGGEDGGKDSSRFPSSLPFLFLIVSMVNNRPSILKKA
jgi:hypothetical protein